MDATSVIWTVVIAVIAALSLFAGGWRLRRARGRGVGRRDR
ncbi:hypothetical protein QF011_000776 [Curtobacterium flaccumfaciens]|nr:hypothetical protein [Curtobacterium flaccumfaciens]MDQ0538235.1 hypothetical protein [Curtobacterium flaccumfaciens]